MMRNILVVILLLQIIVVNAQKYVKPKSEDLVQAERYFANGDYFLAEKYYSAASAAYPEDKYIMYQLAESARHFSDYAKAEEHYAQIVYKKSSTEFPLANFWYAVMLKTNGKYEDAITFFETFATEFKPKTPQDQALVAKGIIESKGCEYALIEKKKPIKNFNFTNMDNPVNTANTDYAPVIYKNDTNIVITSGRDGSTGKKTFNQLGENFSDNYRFEKKAEKWAKAEDKESFNKLNSDFNDGAGIFSKDRKKFYFTRCDQVHEDNNGECAIFLSRFDGTSWIAPVKLNDNINMKGFWTSHPAISSSGDTLYFVSKRPGGKGEHDIWYSVSKGNDIWGPAKNLASINTPFSEIAPCYYEKENTLFFASNGHQGFGGLDIFKATGIGFKNIENIGMPFNSNKDDFYFVLGEKFGYLTSNRDDGKGNDDIYTFTSKSEEAVIAYIEKDTLLAQGAKSGTVEVDLINSETKKPAQDIDLSLKTDKGTVIRTTKTNKEGKGKFVDVDVTKTDLKVTLNQTEKEKALTSTSPIVVKKTTVKTSKSIPVKALFENIYFDFDKTDLRNESKLILKDVANFTKKHPEIQIEIIASADAFGSNDYNARLSQKRGDVTANYLRTLNVDNTSLVTAYGEEKPLASNKNPVGRQLNRRVEIYILGGVGYEAKTMTYVVEPHISLPAIAKQFGMTLDELKELNDIKSNEKVPAFRAIRVRKTSKSAISEKTLIQSKDTIYNSLNDKYDVNATPTSLEEKSNEIIPVAKDEKFYTVKSGDTAYSIARVHGISLDLLLEMNNLKAPLIKVDQKLRVRK